MRTYWIFLLLLIIFISLFYVEKEGLTTDQLGNYPDDLIEPPNKYTMGAPWDNTCIAKTWPYPTTKPLVTPSVTPSVTPYMNLNRVLQFDADANTFSFTNM